MKSTDAPVKQIVPFGANGPREAITATTPSGSNQASYDQGFPPITMTLKSAGGLPPKGQDMNQILYEQSLFARYYGAGGAYTYDASFATGIGGYPLGARLLNSTKSGFWINSVEDNSVSPENATGALTGWVPGDSPGITTISGLSASSVTLNSVQASKTRIVLNGALTANINVVVPAWVKLWQVVNNTTGNFTVTIKTPSGSGVAMASGTTHYVIGDGVNITEDLGSAAFRAVGNSAGQIPDMSYFTSGTGVNSGWLKLPNGFLIQYGYTITSSSTQVNVNFPVSFSASITGGGATYSITPTAAANISATASGSTLTSISGLRTFNTSGAQQSNGVFWIAVGF